MIFCRPKCCYKGCLATANLFWTQKNGKKIPMCSGHWMLKQFDKIVKEGVKKGGGLNENKVQ